MVTSERSAPRFLAGIGGMLLLWMFCSCSSSKAPPPVGFQFVSPSTTPTLDLGESINLTVNQSATWSLQSGCLLGHPAGTFAGGGTTASGSTATYVAPPLQSTLTCAQDVVVATASNQTAALTVQIANPPSITNASSFTYTGVGCNGIPCCPPAGTLITPPTSNVTSLMQVGTFESLGTITAAGGVPPYTWQLASGSGPLPQGLSITPGADSSQILISGTPISAGCASFTLQLADATAPSNCNPQASAACSQSSFNVVVVPGSPKVQVPNYPSAFNDPQNGNQGVPYPPIALLASGTQPPYFWCQAPLTGEQGSTLPPGLVLNSIQPANFSCPSATSNAGLAEISGTTVNGNDQNQNFFCSGSQTGAGCYNTQFQVYDSQAPYPGLTLVTLKNMEDLPLVSCSQSSQAPLLNQGQLNPDAYLTGPVAFLLRGFDAGGPVAIAGSITLDGAGAATGGTVDVTRSTGHRQFSVQKGAGSWYVIGTSAFGVGQFGIGGPNVFDYSRGCMNLTLADSGTPVPPIAFSFTLGGCTNHFAQAQVTSTSQQACGFNNNQPLGTFTTGHLIEFDDNTGSGTRASGVLRVQDSTSFPNGLSGPYAFGLSGGDSQQQRYAIAGSFQATSGTLASIAADVDDGGTCGAQAACNVNATGGSGTYTADPNFGSSNGRWTGTLNVNGQTALGVAIYSVSANEALLVTTDQLVSGHPVIGGEAITTATSFGTASLQNTHIFHISGLAPAGPDVSVGVLSFDGNGSITGGTVYQDQAATLGTTQVSAIYQVDPNTGRAVFSAPSQGQTLGAHPLVAYLIPPSATLTRSNCSSPAACVTGFLVGTDNTGQSGVLEFQTSVTAPPPPFLNQYIAGNYAYGTDQPQDPLTANLEGDVYASPNSASTTAGTLGAGTNPFIQDASYGDSSYFCLPSLTCYLLQPNQFLNGSYTVTANGTGTFGGGVVSVTNGNVTFFIDESPVNKHPSVTVAEQ